MKHLHELGLDTSKASAYWHRVVRLNTGKVVTDWFVSFNKHTPCLAGHLGYSAKRYFKRRLHLECFIIH